jgi:hypothetical protein
LSLPQFSQIEGIGYGLLGFFIWGVTSYLAVALLPLHLILTEPVVLAQQLLAISAALGVGGLAAASNTMRRLTQFFWEVVTSIF